MSEFLLSEYADETALANQTKSILDSFDRIEKRANEVSGSIRSALSGTDGKNIVSKDAIDGLQNLNNKTKDYSATTKVLTSELKANAEAVVKVTAALNDSNKSLNDNVAQRTKLQNSLQSYLTDQKEDLDLLKRGVINRDEYNRRLTESTVRVEKYKNRVAELTKTISTQTQTETQKSAAVSAAAVKEVKIQAELANSYKQLSVQYNEAALKAKILATQLGVGNPVAIQAATNAKKLGEELKQIDASVGQNQRNVGNYAGSLGGFFTQLYSKVRVLANILPGIGISGIFLAAFEGIKLLIGAMHELTADQQILSDVFKKSGDNAGEQVATMSVYKTKLNDVSLSEKDRLIVAKEYNKVADDANQIDLKQIDNLDLINGKIAKQIGLIERQALAQAARAKLGEAASALINAQESLQAGLSGTGLTEEQVKKGVDAQSKLSVAILKTQQTTLDGARKIQAQPGIGEKIESDNDKLSKLSLSVPKKVRDLYASVTKAQLDFDHQSSLLNPLISVDGLATDDKKTGSGAKDKQIQALKDRQNAAFDLYKIAQEAKLRADESDLKSDRVHYIEKLNILEDFVRKSKELLDRQEQNDIALKEKEAAREIQRLNEEKTGKNGKQISRINENIKIVQDNLEQDILKIKAKAADDGLKLIENAAVIRTKIVDDHLKAEAELYAEYAKADQDVLDKTNERFKKALEKRLKQEEEYNKKSAELAKELTQQKIELGLKGEGFLYSLATSVFQRQLNQNKEQQDAVNQKQQDELKANDALVQSAEDKANNITIINARAQAQKDALDKKNRDIETQKAKFERAQQIFEIGISTIKSLALIKANAVALSVNPLYGPVFGKILAAQAMAQIPILLATSALSIGALLAQPLPKYFKGRSKHDTYEGPATMNEVRREVLERKDGSLEYPTGKNVLTYVEKGDIIHPFGDDFMNSLKGSAMRDAGRVAGKGSMSINFSTRAMEGMLYKQNNLLQQIADRPIETTYGTEGSVKSLLRWGMKEIEYTDKSTNW